MTRLRLAALATVVAVAATGLSVSPAAAADQLAACDATAAPALAWSTPSFLAWGRQERIGANVANAGDGPGYVDGSVALKVDAGSASQANDPVDHDLEFVLQAPDHGATLNAGASWTLTDATGTVRCAQSTALSVPLGIGKTLRYRPKMQGNGIAWIPVAAGDCHDIAMQGISLTVAQGSVTRRLNAADQCNPAGTARVASRDWELVLSGGQFHLHALRALSSVRTRLRYALRVGPRRVASGSVSLVRNYRPGRLIVVANHAFQSVCVHGPYQVRWYGATVGCKVPAAFSVHLALA